MTYADIPGWFDFAPLYDAAVGYAPPNSVLVEIGCFLGRSTAYLGQAAKIADKGLSIVAVDTWDGTIGSVDEDGAAAVKLRWGSGRPNLYEQFCANMRHCGVGDVVHPLRRPSVLAAQQFNDGTLPFVFLDADHSYQGVYDDIRAWLPKIAPGGWIAGHDFPRDSVAHAVLGSLGHKAAVFPGVPSCWHAQVKATEG